MLDANSPASHPLKSSQHVRACVEGDGAICSKNRKIVPYHGANPNTRNGARLRSPSPIMAPVPEIFKFEKRMKYANEMTDDVIHSAQYYIKYINRATVANLQRRSLKLGRLIVLQKIHLQL